MRTIQKILCICLIAIASGLQAQNNEYILSYIATYKQMALVEMQRTGVPACITLAQGILESQAGHSELAVSANNHFGIKCKSDWAGSVAYSDDDERNECFRSYQNVNESYKDHSDFLRSKPNYSFLFDINATDYKAWCNGLKKAGYATSPTYAQKLIRLIENYQLNSIVNTDIVSDKQDENLNTDSIPNIEIADEDAIAVIPIPTADHHSAIAEENVVIDYPQGVFQINHSKVLMIAGGTSLLSVAAQYKLSYAQLLSYNELDNSIDVLAVNQLIFLERKSKTGASEFYIVHPGETLYDIAQSAGIRLESLWQYNNFSAATTIQANQKIRLQPIVRKSLLSKK